MRYMINKCILRMHYSIFKIIFRCISIAPSKNYLLLAYRFLQVNDFTMSKMRHTVTFEMLFSYKILKIQLLNQLLKSIKLIVNKKN